jgi:hypothetical protein
MANRIIRVEEIDHLGPLLQALTAQGLAFEVHAPTLCASRCWEIQITGY